METMCKRFRPYITEGQNRKLVLIRREHEDRGQVITLSQIVREILDGTREPLEESR